MTEDPRLGNHGMQERKTIIFMSSGNLIFVNKKDQLMYYYVFMSSALSIQQGIPG
jgi:hypothetical protein